MAVATDVTDRDQVKRLVDTAVQKLGRIDVMLNNAGLMPLAPLKRAPTTVTGIWKSHMSISRCAFQKTAGAATDWPRGNSPASVRRSCRATSNKSKEGSSL